MWDYLEPKHLYRLQLLPKEDKISLFNRLEIIDSIADTQRAANYVKDADRYHNESSILRRDLNMATQNDYDRYFITYKEHASNFSPPASYIDAQNFIQTHLSSLSKDYTMSKNSLTISFYHKEQNIQIKVSVKDTTQAEDVCNLVLNYIELHEKENKAQPIITQQIEDDSNTQTHQRLLHWHIVPVTCGQHYWVLACCVDVENKKLHRIILNSAGAGSRAKESEELKERLLENHYKLVEHRNLIFKNPSNMHQTEFHNSGLYAIQNIKAVLELKDKLWDLYLGTEVELEVEEITIHTRLIRHAELIYFYMMHETRIDRKKSNSESIEEMSC